MLIHLRKENPVLWQGHFRFLKADRDDRRVIYERIDEKHLYTIWMNNTGEGTVIAHPMETADWQDALSGEEMRPVAGTMHIELEPFGYRILRRTL